MAKQEKEGKKALPTFVNKVTVRSIGYKKTDLDSIVEENEESVLIARFYGRISKSEAGSGTLGDFVKFKGSHEAVNLISQKVYRSKTLILPAIAEGMLIDLLNEAQKDAPEAIMEYGIDISVMPNPSYNGNGAKYQFGMVPLMAPAAEDSVSQLGQKFGALPQISA